MKKFTLFTLAAASLFTLISCQGVTYPKSVAVKTGSADYDFTVANVKDFDLSTKLNIKSMISSATSSVSGNGSGSEDGPQISIYSYNPEGKAKDMQLALAMSLKDVSLDVGKYLENVNLTDGLGNMSMGNNEQNEPYSVTIPNLSQTVNQEVTLESVDSVVNAIIKLYGVTTTSEQNINILMDEGNNFESITYQSGFLTIRGAKDAMEAAIISASGTPCTAGTLTGSVLIKYNGSEVTEVIPFENGVAKIPLTNLSLYKENMSITFTGVTPGIGFIGEIASGSKLKSAQKLTLSTPITISVDDQTIDTGNNSNLKSCTIEEGSLTVEVQLPQDTWNNVGLDYTINLSGGLNGTFTQSNTTLSLDGTSFSNASVSASISNATVTLNNSDITFTDSPNLHLNLTVSKIASAQIQLDQSFNQSVDYEYDIPSDVTKYIKKIKWHPTGLRLKYTNTLPAGNDIKLKAQSSFLQINKEETLEGDKTEKTISFVCPDNLESDLTVNNKIDFKADITLTNFDENSKILTIVGVQTDKTYTIGMTIEPIFDDIKNEQGEITENHGWKSIDINAEVANQEGTMPTGMSLGSIFPQDSVFSDYANKVELSSVPVYLYCDIPSIAVFDKASFAGTIKAYLADKEDDTHTDVAPAKAAYFLGTADADATLQNCSAPAFPEDAETELTVNLAAEGTYSATSDLKNLLNASLDSSNSNTELCLTYKLGFDTGESGTITVPKTDLDDLQNTQSVSIKLSAVLVLPFKFNVTSPIEMDLLEMIGKKDENNPDWDLFNRSEAPSLDKVEQFMDIVSSARLTCKTGSMPIKTTGDGIKLVIDWDGDKQMPASSLSLKEGKKDTLKIEGIADIVKQYPLQPSIKIEIANGEMALARDMKMSALIGLGISTDSKEFDLLSLFNSDKESQEE